MIISVFVADKDFILFIYLFFTLFRGTQQNREAVVSLELIEVRSYLDLVVCVALQI